MIVNDVNEQQIRRWLSGLCLGAAGAVAGASRMLEAGEAVAGALLFATCLLMAGGVLAGLAVMLGQEAERFAATYRPPVGFGAHNPSRRRSFACRLRVGALERLGVDAEILAVWALGVGLFVALEVLAGTT